MKLKLFLTIATAICCCSCSKNDSESFESEFITEADVFLVSDDFKQYEQVVMNDSRVVRNALNALTVDEKTRYFTLMKSASPEMTENEYENIVAEIKELTGIDTDARLKKLHGERVKLLSKISFSKEELLKAMQRQCLNMKNIALTRSSTEISRTECLRNCENIYMSVYSACDPTGGYGPGLVLKEEDYDLWYQTRYCEMIAAEAYDNCAMGCD